ncbi:hypothetical protein [Hyphomicrobium sp.]|uniref:hypothetical protein n=1 Tax=Hyphomicrobium sp. TaxID=82 RepID=UPI002D77AC4D|nr:hypothetical protein [Hyphomicrobium sp.]HET6390751.1 hypothetical protein [Hyphomicrobium sp.]
MGDRATIETLLSAAVFLIPVAVLLTLFALFLRRKPKLPRETSSKQQPAPPSPTPSPAPSPLAAGLDVAPPQPEPPIEDVETLNRKIELALGRGDKTALSGLYYDLAASHERMGNTDARMAALRSAAGYGALHGPETAHAAARVALAEAAQRAGDLTSACEQWQMARTAYLKAGDTDRHDSIEKRMRDNGCPTDWVLTDF